MFSGLIIALYLMLNVEALRFQIVLETGTLNGAGKRSNQFFYSRSVCPPPKYVMRPPVTENVPLHSKSLCKNVAHAFGGCK